MWHQVLSVATLLVSRLEPFLKKNTPLPVSSLNCYEMCGCLDCQTCICVICILITLCVFAALLLPLLHHFLSGCSRSRTNTTWTSLIRSTQFRRPGRPRRIQNMRRSLYWSCIAEQGGLPPESLCEHPLPFYILHHRSVFHVDKNSVV